MNYSLVKSLRICWNVVSFSCVSGLIVSSGYSIPASYAVFKVSAATSFGPAASWHSAGSVAVNSDLVGVFVVRATMGKLGLSTLTLICCCYTLMLVAVAVESPKSFFGALLIC